MRHIQQLLQRLCCIAICAALPAFASVVQPGDGPYWRVTDNNTQFIFEERAQEFIHQLIAYNRAIHAMYERSFDWQLDERLDVVLTSPAQQVANAYASPIPNLKTVWFPSGARMLEEMAESSWLMALTTHESAHLYQVNSKGGVGRWIKPVLGNSIVSFVFVVPIFVHPNIFAPTFLLEGNATFNESRLNMGGRLHSGEKRALVYAQVKAKKINPNRLINSHLDFPFGEEKYLQGGYLFAHLAAKHGVDKANAFFRANGRQFMWPFNLNGAFRRHFGDSYPQEIREYVRKLEVAAAPQKTTRGAALDTATFFGSMNADDKNIWLLMSDELKPPRLIRIDKQTGALDKKTMDLPLGKVFFTDGEPKASSSEQHDLHNMEYSLYGRGLKLDKRYLGQIVVDQRGGKTLALDARNSWLDPHLLLDGQFYDLAHSSAVFDKDGHIYYFRQNGMSRVLYRDREPLFKYEGYYGKIMEVADDGIYFIGNTEYGSSLYRYSGKEIQRVLDSDTVIEARKLNGDEFVTVEVTAKGYELKRAKSTALSQVPVNYQYGFATENLVPGAIPNQKDILGGKKSYNGLWGLRYSHTDVTLGSTGAGFAGTFLTEFADPLEYHSASLMYSRGRGGADSAAALYTYSRYLPNFLLGYFYDSGSVYKDTNDDENLRIGRFYDQEAVVGVLLPVLKHRRISADVREYVSYEKDDIFNDTTRPRPDYRETYGLKTRFNLDYTLNPMLGLRPWRQFQLQYSNNVESLPSEFKKQDNTSQIAVGTTFGFGREYYLGLAGSYSWAETRDIKLVHDIDMINPSLDIRISRIASDRTFYVERASVGRIELQKVFNTPAYSPRIPIGLVRIAPLVTAQYIGLDDRFPNSYPNSIFEYGGGADVHVLLFHKFNLVTRVIGGFDDVDDKTYLTIRAGYSKGF